MAEPAMPEGLTPVDEQDARVIERNQPAGPATGSVELPKGLTPVEYTIGTPGISDLLTATTPEIAQDASTLLSEEQKEYLREEGPQALGGMAFGVASGGMSLLPALGMTFLGGAGGEAYKDLYNYFVNPEDAPKDFSERVGSLALAGGEEAALEGAGRGLITIVGKGYHVIRPKLREGMKEMNRLFEQYGGKFTMAQQTSHFGWQVLDGLVRGSISGRGVMLGADQANDAALRRWRQDLSSMIATTAREGMTDGQFGKLMFDTLEQGDGAFRSYTSNLYGSLDDLVKTETREVLVERQLPSNIVDERGKALFETQVDRVVEELRPVDVTPLKQEAADLLVRMENAANIPKSDFGGDLIDKTLKLDDALTFQTAQDVRSSFLQWARVAENGGDAKLAGSLNRFVTKITEAMDQAAKNQSPETFLKYQAIKREAKEGYEAFNDQFIWKFLNDKISLEKFSDELFRPGNSELIPRFRKALNVAAKRDPRINPAEVMDNVKQHYLESILNGSSKVLETSPDITLRQFDQTKGVPIADELSKFFGEDPKRATMNKLFSPREQELLFEFQKALQRTQAPSEAGVSILAPMFQAQAAGGAIANPGLQAVGRAAAFFLPAEMLAKWMTREPALKLLTSAAKTPIWAKQAPSILLKLKILKDNYERQQAGETTLGEDVKKFLSDAGVNIKEATMDTIGLRDDDIDRIFERIDKEAQNGN